MVRPTIMAALVLCGIGAGACTPDAEAPQAKEPSIASPAPVVRRLTATQYEAAVSALLGPGLVMPTSLEPDLPVDGLLAIGAGVTSVSEWGVERYEDAAYLLAEQAMADDAWVATHLPCGTASFDEACTHEALAALGREAWRRPLSEAEVDRLVGVVQSVTDDADFTLGLTYGLAALLQSPYFVYRVEQGEPDGAERRLNDWETASRLAFLLWNAPPDRALLDAVEDGALSTPKGLRKEAERMMDDPRYRDGLRAFFSDVLELYRLDELTKDPLVYTHASPDLGPSAREETLLLLEDLVIDQDGDFRDLMTTRDTFVDQRLAALYDIEAPSPTGHARTTLPMDGRRHGLLGHASVLNLQAHSGSSSATLRGVFVLQTLLCKSVPPPPAGLNTSIPEPDVDSPTLRQRLLVHQEDPACATCHAVIDPVGLGLENFDGVGRWRDTENGATIDPSGDVDGLAFHTAWTLGQRVREHENFLPCWASHLYAYTTAHLAEGPTEAYTEWLAGELVAADHSWRAMTLAAITSDAFRQVGEVSP